MSRIIAAAIAVFSVAQVANCQWNNPNGDGNLHIYMSNTSMHFCQTRAPM